MQTSSRKSPLPEAMTWFESPVGPLIAAATREAVCLLEFCEPQGIEQRLAQRRAQLGAAAAGADSALLGQLRREMHEYFSGARREFSLPLVYGGTPFQERVWSALRQIPYGQTWSYLDLALRVADAEATRAVGAANGMNPIAIIIPCHRVINSGGALGGYGGGLWRKQVLLDLEQGQHRLPW